LLSLALIFLIVLPVVALGGYFGELARLLGQVVLTIVLVLSIAATGLFGYICLRAQARKWGTGLILLAVLFVVITYLVWTGHLPFL
jgi:uncharacterized membrane protein (DUF4010 family)